MEKLKTVQNGIKIWRTGELAKHWKQWNRPERASIKTLRVSKLCECQKFVSIKSLREYQMPFIKTAEQPPPTHITKVSVQQTTGIIC